MAKAKTKATTEKTTAANGHAAKAPPKPKTKRHLQQEMPGTDHDRIKELDDLAEVYVEARDTRMECTEAETKAKKALHEAMKKHDLTQYKVLSMEPHRVVEIVTEEETVKVKKADDAPKKVPKAAVVEGHALD